MEKQCDCLDLYWDFKEANGVIDHHFSSLYHQPSPTQPFHLVHVFWPIIINSHRLTHRQFPQLSSFFVQARQCELWTWVHSRIKCLGRFHAPLSTRTSWVVTHWYIVAPVFINLDPWAIQQRLLMEPLRVEKWRWMTFVCLRKQARSS